MIAPQGGLSSFFFTKNVSKKSSWTPGPGGYSTLGWVRMCGPKFRPPPCNKTREDANLQPITKPFASWRTLFKTNQYFLPYKLGFISTFWQPIGKLKGKIQRKLCILQKCDLYLNQFSNKKGAIGKPERPKKHPIWAAHPRTHLSTKYPPRTPGLNINPRTGPRVRTCLFHFLHDYYLGPRSTSGLHVTGGRAGGSYNRPYSKNFSVCHQH